ncbi:MAG: hypothetical protein Q7W56_03695 [Candidatus Latescibacteria bacterium]|nr:hypothetical protein [Candidatus Latescibacterota bacterium]
MRTPLTLIFAWWTVCAAATVAAADPDRILIPHVPHHDASIECTTCHAAATDSRRAGDSLRPGMDVCADCHDVVAENGCAKCHTNVEAAGTTPYDEYPAQKFSHAAHTAQGMACTSCHGSPLSTPRLPTKPDCRVCHATAENYGDCRLCHADGMELRPDSHDALWTGRHGAQARQNEALCATCHTQGTCQQCHTGDNLRPRVHPLDFAFGHAVRARGREQECTTCHGEPEFCSSCHVAQNVLPESHSRAGWVRLPDGGRHAVDGVFDLESCIACHDDGRSAPTCAACHGG